MGDRAKEGLGSSGSQKVIPSQPWAHCKDFVGPKVQDDPSTHTLGSVPHKVGRLKIGGFLRTATLGPAGLPKAKILGKMFYSKVTDDMPNSVLKPCA